MELIVHSPHKSFGSSNDGNTSRRFFENPALSSDITGVKGRIDTLFLCTISREATNQDLICIFNSYVGAKFSINSGQWHLSLLYGDCHHCGV